MGFGSLGGRFTTVEGLLQEVSLQVCGCLCTGVWVWACLCVDVSVCAGVSSGRVCVFRCVGMWVCLCRCVGVGKYVCAGVWGDLNHTLYHYIALTFFHSPLHSHSLPHTTSSFHVYRSSSLFIHLHLVIVHLTTQRCRDLSVSSKRWRLTALNMLRVLHTPPYHTHTCTEWDM